MKKFLKILTIFFISVVLITFAIGYLLYSKGPHFALRKAQSIAAEKFQIHFNFKKIEFINQNELSLIDFEFQNDKIDFLLKSLTVKFNIDYEKRSLEILNVHLMNPIVRITTNEKFQKQNANVVENKPFSIENYIISPPDQIKFKELSVTNLNVFYNQNMEMENGILKSNIINLQNQDLKLGLRQKPGELELILNTVLNNSLNYKSKTNDTDINLQISKFIANLKILIQKNNSGLWTYQVMPLNLSQVLDKVEINKFFKTKLKSHFVLKNHNFNLELTAKDETKNLFQFIDFYPNFIDWKISSKVQSFKFSQIQKYLTENNFLEVESHGNLTQTISSPKTFGIPYTWNLSLKAKGGPFQVDNHKSLFSLSTQWQNNVGQISLNTSQSKLLSFSAKTEVQNHSTQIEGLIQTKIPKNFMETLITKKIKGEITLPFHLVYQPSHDPHKFNLHIDSKINFSDFNIEADNFKLFNINGEIPIVEEITINKNEKDFLSFQSIFVQNPFERVDYNRIDPFVRSSEPLKIEQITWAGRNFGSFEGTVNLKQNFLALHKMSLILNKGTANGEFFIDLNSKTRRVGFLGRFTNVDLSEILPKRYLPPHSAMMPFSSRMGLIFSFANRTLDGRMDITQLGSQQLYTFINLIDPFYLDEKMNKVRSWLEIGKPNQIMLGFNEGNMNMDLDITAFNIQKKQSINGISIQSFINKALETKKESL